MDVKRPLAFSQIIFKHEKASLHLEVPPFTKSKKKKKKSQNSYRVVLFVQKFGLTNWVEKRCKKDSTAVASSASPLSNLITGDYGPLDFTANISRNVS